MMTIAIGAGIFVPVVKTRFRPSQPPVFTCSADNDGVGIEGRRGDEGREERFVGHAYLE